MSADSERAEELFAEFLLATESGEAVGIEDVVEKHPELEEELRRLHANLCQADLVLDPGEPQDAPAPREGRPPSSRILAELERREQDSSRYRHGKEVARGGMGSIRRVWDEGLQRWLAMKVVRGPIGRPRDDASEARLRTRFLEEARVTAQLDHPGIVPIHDVGRDDTGQLYFTMKLVEGRTFAEVIDLMLEGRDGWDLSRAIEVLMRVCDAVAYAHSKGIVHRDLKPSNIMVGRFGEVYVMDWGLARVLGGLTAIGPREQPVEGSSGRITLDGEVLGTPAYMAPEQADDSSTVVGPTADVYAIGSILYHTLAGRMPYGNGDSYVDGEMVLSRLRAGPPTRIETLAKRAPAELVSICIRAMQREPSRRYLDVVALGRDLRAFLELRTVEAHRVGPWVELRKWVRRNRLASVALLFAVFGLFGALVATREYVRASEGEASAKADRDQMARGVEALFDSANPASLRGTKETAASAAKQLIQGLQGISGAQLLIARLYDFPELDPEEGLALLDGGRSLIFALPIPGDTRRALLRKLALAYSSLGRYDASGEIQSQVGELARLANADDEVLSASLNQSTQHIMQGDQAAAEEILVTLVPALKERMGATHEATLIARMNQGIVLKNTGQLFEALAVQRSVVADWESTAPRGDHRVYLTARHALGMVQLELGELDGLVDEFREIYEAERDVLGAGDPDTLNSLFAVAMTLSAERNLEEAEEAFLECHSEMLAHLGPHHAKTLGAVNGLAQVLRDLGKHGDALAWLDLADRGVRENYGDVHAFRAILLSVRGTTLYDMGRPEKAEEALREGVEILTKVNGPEHIETLHAVIDLSKLLAREGQFEEALQLREEALAGIPEGSPWHASVQAEVDKLREADAADD